MKTWKTTALLLIATIGIGAYISLYEIKQPTPRERERRTKYVLDIPPETVTQIAIDLPLAKATLTRTGSGWRLSPMNVRANGTLIDQLLTEAYPLVAERVLVGSPEQPLEPKTFGLDPAMGWVSLIANNVPTTLLIGEETPVGKNRYVKRADRPDIFVVSSTVFQTINQPIESYRDPLLIRFDGWLMQTLSVTSPALSYTLSRRETSWHLTAPHTDRADHTAVTTLVNQLGAMPIKRFVDDAPAAEPLSSWGFDHLTAEVSLRHDDPPLQTTLFFGKALPDDATLVYAKRSDEPALYAVAAADVDRLLHDPNELRAKACFEFSTGNVRKVQLIWPQNEWTLERNEQSAWRAVEREETLDRERIEAFLNSLGDVRLERFVDEAPSNLDRYGLTSPQGSVTVWTTDTEAPQRLDIGTTIEGSKGRYGRLEGRAPVVALPEQLNTLLATTPEAFIPKAASAPESADAPAGSAAPPSPE